MEFLLSFALWAVACFAVSLLFERLATKILLSGEDEGTRCAAELEHSMREKANKQRDAEQALRESLVTLQYGLAANDILECSDSICY